MYRNDLDIYASPRLPKKWMFHPPKRSGLPAVVGTMLATFALMMALAVLSHP